MKPPTCTFPEVHFLLPQKKIMEMDNLPDEAGTKPLKLTDLLKVRTNRDVLAYYVVNKKKNRVNRMWYPPPPALAPAKATFGSVHYHNLFSMR